MIRTMQEWLRRDLYERGYEEVITPHVYNADVWKTSGHYGFYKREHVLLQHQTRAPTRIRASPSTP